MAVPRILITGATGYIGGTILHRLITNALPTLGEVSITVLVRGEDRAKRLEEKYGSHIKCVEFDDWNQGEFLQVPSSLLVASEIASQHDIVINAGSGFHPPSAEALVRGLAKRKERRGPAWMLHTSGCSNIADMPMTGTARPDAEYHDADAEAVYEFEKLLEANEGPYPQRTSELLVLDTGIETGVNVLSVQAPCIFGPGEGLFQQAGLVIPILMAYVLSRGYGFALHQGTAVIDIVHVADLADWYIFCILQVLRNGGSNLPSGKKGIVFPTNGRKTMYSIAMDCAKAAFDRGVLPNDAVHGPKEPEVRTVDLAEAATTTAGNLQVAEAGWGGHRRTTGTVAKALGWNPVHGLESWNEDLEHELSCALEGKRGVTIDNCIAEK
ncbi:hypothetical protein PFICI_14657 [Pestalotiopsis fici W106-1]|uniref:NAD-dependent epimerase/dehydratase domain-containing protein n=1 Tax=Pestalotiopsis fici (strain W106-1 / CGMCC3.15140) TaxID=1229662 RepID=W3WLL6_PESFW|nr:uncharacterized protein PFICI_14657 [Pestalotiopsis fici W106-1]ETS73711.1 hypothetical protein PFICI_14657 [Pestalotiopsis fici W106-1]